jgi:hypothetical protein
MLKKSTLSSKTNTYHESQCPLQKFSKCGTRPPQGVDSNLERKGVAFFNLPQALCSRSDCCGVLSLWIAFPSVSSTRKKHVLLFPQPETHTFSCFLYRKHKRSLNIVQYCIPPINIYIQNSVVKQVFFPGITIRFSYFYMYLTKPFIHVK